MKTGKIVPLLIVVLLSAGSCGDYKPQVKRLAVAKAGEKILYYDQIPNSLPPGITSADSTAHIHNYINRWAKREIMKMKALQNLTPEFKTEVERQVEEMRSNLLIHHYQQQMIDQKMDTVVTEAEIENYYAAKESSFVLNSNIVKALFIRIPSDIPNLEKVNGWYRSNNPADIAQLELFCYQFADKFDDFNEKWIPMNLLVAELPGVIDNQEEFLRRNSYFETEDLGFKYFVSIREYKVRGTIAPFDYVTENIKSMILNTRRMEFLQSLETGIFNEAIRENTFTIYK
jgi:hypothetical protein